MRQSLQVKNFENIKKNFYKNIIKCDKLKPNFKIAIENHQDLTSLELLEIVQLARNKKIYINWDIGNSLATFEISVFFIDLKNISLMFISKII